MFVNNRAFKLRYWSRRRDRLRARGFCVTDDPVVLEAMAGEMQPDPAWMGRMVYASGVLLFGAIALWLTTGRGFGTGLFATLYDLVMAMIIVRTVVRHRRQEQFCTSDWKD